MRKMAVFLVLIASAWFVLHLHERQETTYDPLPAEQADALDGALDGVVMVPRQASIDPWDVTVLSIIIASYLVAVAALMLGSHHKREWSWQGLAMLGAFGGDALFYWALLGPRVTPWDATEPYVDLIRSVFVVSGPILVICLIHWMVKSPPQEDHPTTLLKVPDPTP